MESAVVDIIFSTDLNYYNLFNNNKLIYNNLMNLTITKRLNIYLYLKKGNLVINLNFVFKTFIFLNLLFHCI